MRTQVIYCGDNLTESQKIPDQSIDIIYVDPPFQTSAQPTSITSSASDKGSSWQTQGTFIDNYISWMQPRAVEFHRLLKLTGSLYYHCDAYTDAYIRLMLDRIFGVKNFNTQIIWHRTAVKKTSSRSFTKSHDVILFYNKSKDYLFNKQYIPIAESRLRESYKYVESETGRRYCLEDLTSPRQNSSHLTYEFLGINRAWRLTKERMQEAYEQGRIIQARPGSVPTLKRYLDEQQGTPISSVWNDIATINSQSGERLGYPTQKPLSLINRLIQTSSNEGDIVLDPFCGSGTTLHSAQSLGRKWIGIDISPTACQFSSKRLIQNFNLIEGKDFEVLNLPETLDAVREYSLIDLENWIITALGMVFKQGSSINDTHDFKDIGIDAKILSANELDDNYKSNDLKDLRNSIVVQVKRKDEISQQDIEHFRTAMRLHKCHRGIFVAFGFTASAKQSTIQIAQEEGLDILLMTMEDVLKLSNQRLT